MNAKHVLSKIASILNLSDSTPIQAKTEDGTILQSANFDVNDEVFVVGADGKTTPAEDGEYTITFTTPEGNDSTQVIDIDGGKIAGIETPEEHTDVENGTDDEDENMDEESDENAEEAESKPLVAPKAGVKAASAKVTDSVKEAEKGEAKGLPNTTEEDDSNVHDESDTENNDPLIRMSARLDALEKTMADIKSKFDEVNPDMPAGSLAPTISMSAEDEDELPKLDGAPVDTQIQIQNKQNYNKKTGDYQSTVLSKMYR